MSLELSVVLPCLNEVATLGVCISKINQSFSENDISGEIIVADNGSTDGSIDVALQMNVKLVEVSSKGYGNALRAGIEVAQGKYIIMGDADDSYNFLEIPIVLKSLRLQNELVMGNRFKGGIKPHAMPFLHRYIGNPILSWLGSQLFKIPIGDFHCGLRGFEREAYMAWNLHSTGMEFASEMVVKASLANARISEVPVTLSPDGRNRPPHLQTWEDGWRHLHFLLVHSPRWLYLFPGLLLAIIGMVLFVWLLPQPRTVYSITFDVHTLLVAMSFVISGLQLLWLGVLSRISSARSNILPFEKWMDYISDFKRISILIFSGIGLILFGFVGILLNFLFWQKTGFTDLLPQQMLRSLLPAILLLIMGFQTFSNAFFISIINQQKKV
ncbi:MAG: glycosyltransferase [Spirosomataceae bacterium]